MQILLSLEQCSLKAKRNGFLSENYKDFMHLKTLQTVSAETAAKQTYGHVAAWWLGLGNLCDVAELQHFKASAGLRKLCSLMSTQNDASLEFNLLPLFIYQNITDVNFQILIGTQRMV